MLRLVVTGSLRWGRVVASVQHQRVRAAGGERSEDEVALLAAELELEEREAVGCAPETPDHDAKNLGSRALGRQIRTLTRLATMILAIAIRLCYLAMRDGRLCLISRRLCAPALLVGELVPPWICS